VNATLNLHSSTRSSADPRDAFRGQSRSPNIVSFHILCTLSSRAIVTWTSRCAIFLIFDVKKCRDLEIWVSENGIIRQIADGFLLVFYRNIVLNNMHRSWDIRLQKCRDPKTGLLVRQGHWKWDRFSRFDTIPAVTDTQPAPSQTDTLP